MPAITGSTYITDSCDKINNIAGPASIVFMSTAQLQLIAKVTYLSMLFILHLTWTVYSAGHINILHELFGQNWSNMCYQCNIILTSCYGLMVCIQRCQFLESISKIIGNGCSKLFLTRHSRVWSAWPYRAERVRHSGHLAVISSIKRASFYSSLQAFQHPGKSQNTCCRLAIFLGCTPILHYTSSVKSMMGM